MTTLLKRLWNDERGFIVSAEIVLIVTIGVLGIIVGINSVASSINNELNDVSSAFGAVDQSYWYSGLVKVGHSGISGSAFSDSQDFCDCTSIVRTVPGAKIQTGNPVPPIGPPPRVVPPPVAPPVCPPATVPPAVPHGPGVYPPVHGAVGPDRGSGEFLATRSVSAVVQGCARVRFRMVVTITGTITMDTTTIRTKARSILTRRGRT